MELWTIRIPETGTAEAQAERAEAAGWDGIAFTDSQNLIGDPFVAMALGAKVTDRLRFATGVTNVATRHPAALATVAATVQEVSGVASCSAWGGVTPPCSTWVARRSRSPPSSAGDTAPHLPRRRHRRLRRLPEPAALAGARRQPRVPIDIAASGPKVIAFAASTVERVTLAIGADAERMAWGLAHARNAMADAGRSDDVSFGAYVTVGCHPDRSVAREMIRGNVAAFAHFSAMPGSTGAGLAERDRAVVAEVGDRYDSNLHLVNAAPHAAGLDADFVDRFAVVGPPDECVRRLDELAALGIERFVITGVSFGADAEQARRADHLVREEVLPALRERWS